MSAKDIFHEAVKPGLEKDQWQISNDPLELVWEEVKVKIDLAAEWLIAAERGEEKLPSGLKALSACLQLATSILHSHQASFATAITAVSTGVRATAIFQF